MVETERNVCTKRMPVWCWMLATQENRNSWTNYMSLRWAVSVETPDGGSISQRNQQKALRDQAILRILTRNRMVQQITAHLDGCRQYFSSQLVFQSQGWLVYTFLYKNVVSVCFIDSLTSIWDVLFTAGSKRISRKFTRWFVIIQRGESDRTEFGYYYCLQLGSNPGCAMQQRNHTTDSRKILRIPLETIQNRIS